MDELFENSILDELFEKRKIEFINHIRAKNEIEEEKRRIEDEESFTNLLKKRVKAWDYEEVIDKLNELETSIIDESNYWNKMFYKLGLADYEMLNNEMINRKLRKGFINKESANDFLTKKL